MFHTLTLKHYLQRDQRRPLAVIGPDEIAVGFGSD
jgi:hypothetical protein